VTFDGEFEARVVLLTGAASGMGASHARRFAAVGAHVGCIDVRSKPLQALVQELEDSGAVVDHEVADVADWEALSGAADALRERLGPASIVIANAGILSRGEFVQELEPAEWQRVIDVNLTGVFHTAKAGVPQLRESDGGALVLVSSTAGIGAGPGNAAYYAAKHGVLGLMRTLANELGPEGITVNAVCPGWVDTPMLDQEAGTLGIDRDEAAQLWAAEHIIERLVKPEEVSDAILWLASAAARMVTGVALPIDGGLLEKRFRM
jgi:NAD(P)-dependent dehydrogenase (short-subunit alcohol dehydrogenase family)